MNYIIGTILIAMESASLVPTAYQLPARWFGNEPVFLIFGLPTLTLLQSARMLIGFEAEAIGCCFLLRDPEY